MKTYRIEHTRPGADDPCDEYVPAEVAQRLYEALKWVNEREWQDKRGEDIPQHFDEWLESADDALAAADGEEV